MLIPFLGASQPVFGVDLTNAVAETHLADGLDIPCIVRSCISFVHEHGLEEVGVYRVSGRATDVQAVRKHFDTLMPDHVHVAASVLKAYFRELPDPLLTHQLRPDFMALVEQDAGPEQLARQLQALPLPHYQTLAWLIFHLAEIARHAEENRMQPDNIFIVFCPTLQINRVGWLSIPQSWAACAGPAPTTCTCFLPR
ncbi:uncharacterized protein MONBRDRAFT_14763 [Monosiga brevicollis MX1]|uniref:Rho-GAP domain-containing protein n=1 Tax=Monosiga brevicollis TaxID=81824 RepID=A9URK9_MONBE|nr:uncharacterized protein MONBRDRAFT_14763 [Monosiga brevicollis MX1]EDQ92261.1 predicted protein [Monosiga brevicollis MX1]|eukprot:XP_001743547.1 hypothetical protein [Monosiga brevicollis MX1]